jgi:hypothetical protein
MHLDEGVEPVAQKAPVLSRGHAVEQLKELILLLGGSRNHVLCLCMLSSAFGRAERTGWGGVGGGGVARVTPSQVRMSEKAVVFGGGRVRKEDPPRIPPSCVHHARRARARADKDEDSAIYEKEGGVMRCLGAGIWRLGRQRYRLAAPVRLCGSVCGGAAARWLGRAGGGQM